MPSFKFFFLTRKYLETNLQSCLVHEFFVIQPLLLGCFPTQFHVVQGINFFHWGDGLTSRDLSRYIWTDADWPQNGWAGTDSTPVPTCVSPGIGLASDRGPHLGLGGATVGVGSQTRGGRDLASYGGLGWGIQGDFDNSIDPPATLDNINARTLASHPLRPFFLVGSYNTHIYLWEVCDFIECVVS